MRMTTYFYATAKMFRVNLHTHITLLTAAGTICPVLTPVAAAYVPLPRFPPSNLFVSTFTAVDARVLTRSAATTALRCSAKTPRKVVPDQLIQ